MVIDSSNNLWDENLSARYLEYGRYFVPDREQQMHMMVDLLKDFAFPLKVLELCCGEGLLAEMLLEELVGASYIGMDGSELMLERAKQRLLRFAGRFQLISFALADYSWRKADEPVQAVVSSLAIHHLDEAEKKRLFQDVCTMLAPEGIFVVADMIEPASAVGRVLAANAWDDVVRQRCLELVGSTDGLAFFQREGWNIYRSLDPDDIDHPSGLYEQLNWLESAGFTHIDVHFMQAGHALFSGWKKVYCK
jgi:tRNA (cmo5U34)-methyltransferase